MAASLLNHSWYSLLQGVSSPEHLISEAARLGYQSLALTDTNNLLGAVAFHDLALSHGIKPILGSVLRTPVHSVVALIQNRAGYRSLCCILSRLNLNDDANLGELLLQFNQGLHLLVDTPELLELLHRVYASRVWAGINRSGRRRSVSSRQRKLLECADRLRVSPVALHGCYFAQPGLLELYRVVRAIRECTLLQRLRDDHVGLESHLLPLDEFHELFCDIPEALTNASLLAGTLEVDVLPHELILPEPLDSRGMESVVHLRALCVEGMHLRRLYKNEDAELRLEEELKIIHARSLDGYFLTVNEITRLARSDGHTPALRGSAGNSLVCYLLGITDVDPLRHNLVFERFLHMGRVDLPDIDLDFDWKIRDALIEHVLEQRGRQYAARISSHLFLQPRSALRESAKVHGLSEEQISVMGPEMEKRLEPYIAGGKGELAPPHYSSCPLGPLQWKQMFRHARLLVGRPHHLSIHPGGIVITPNPIEEYAPLQWSRKGVVITQYEKDAVEKIGLVKIDLLGNRALATVDEASRLAGERILPHADMPEEDPKVGELLLRGDTLGVNQMESPGMRHLLVQMQAHSLDDVIQSLALIRPGAASIGMKERFIRRRRGIEKPVSIEPALAKLLGDTQLMLLYEDDSLRLLKALAQLSPSDADAFRKKVTKWETEEQYKALAIEFFTLCEGSGVSKQALSDLWLQLSKFNRYSFCKSHAVSYGIIAWKAVWLKAYHPREFWTAALNNNQGTYPRHVYIEAIRRAGIPLFAPCVNRSRGDFSLEENGIRVGLDAIAGLTQNLKLLLYEERAHNGPYTSLSELITRLQPGAETLALLIQSGACDCFGLPRPVLYLQAESELRRSSQELFTPRIPDRWAPVQVSKLHKARDEWQTLGFTLEMPLIAMLRSSSEYTMPVGFGNITSCDDFSRSVGKKITIEGTVATARRTTTESGKPMQFISLEDETGLADVVLFPGNCNPIAHLSLGPYVVQGIVEEHHGVAVLAATKISSTQGKVALQAQEYSGGFS